MHDMYGTGCLTKVGVICKNDPELMAKIHSPDGYNRSLEAPLDIKCISSKTYFPTVITVSVTIKLQMPIIMAWNVPQAVCKSYTPYC